MKNWEESFKGVCEEMADNGETERSLQPRGVIVVNPYGADAECPYCASQNILAGKELDYGPLYECATARYCCDCKRVFGAKTGANFAVYCEGRFLPVMKAKLAANLDAYRTVVRQSEHPCPECGGTAYIFCKDLGAVDFYDNYWTVCVNPECLWPGKHHETYEQNY